MTDFDNYLKAAKMHPPRRAPYAFVKVEDVVLPSPVALERISHTRPLDDGLCGTLTISLTNETPLLVGARSTDNNRPLEIGDHWAIPGATIRGMTRAVAEIATFARLNFVSDYHGARRDFNDVNPIINPPRQKVPYANTGWLFARDVSEKQDKTFEYRLIPAVETFWMKPQDLPAVFGPADHWHEMAIGDRFVHLDGKCALGLVDGTVFGRAPGQSVQLFVTDKRAGDPNADTYKCWELLSIWDGDPTIHPIAQATGDAFRLSLKNAKTLAESKSQAVLDKAANFGACTEFDKQFLNPASHAIHVVWRNPGVGQDGQARPQPDAVLSLSAYWKVPFRNGLLDVARKTQSGLAKSGNDQPLDLVEALFGWASEDIDDSVPLKQRAPRDIALRSRVKFGFARADKRAQDTEDRTMPGIAPRPSFFPFYLTVPVGKSHPGHFDHPDAKLAGRKRYPARNKTATAPTVNDRQSATCTFLTRDHTFTGEVRLHNVSRIELGALVWALTLGQHGRDQGFRHMLGRGKSYGFGQVRLKITDTKLRKVGGGAAPDLQEALNDFKVWVLEKLGQKKEVFEDLEPIKRLLNISHAATGEQLSLQGALAFPEVQPRRGSDADPIVTGYKELRDLAMKRFGDPKQFLIVSQTPGEDGFISLAAYPRLNE